MPRFTLLLHRVSTPIARGDQLARGDRALASGIATGEIHWDWLFEPLAAETDSSLADGRDDLPGLLTWATDPPCPLSDSSALSFPVVTTAALQLADHRRQYLDFEGPIGRDRGDVQQIATGRYALTRQSSSVFQAELMITRSRYLQVNQRVRLDLRRLDPASGSGLSVWELRTASLTN